MTTTPTDLWSAQPPTGSVITGAVAQCVDCNWRLALSAVTPNPDKIAHREAQSHAVQAAHIVRRGQA